MFQVTESKVLADRDACKVYVLNDVTYVPHYQNDQFFVGPGFPKFQTKMYSEEDLMRGGAKEQWLMLWPRPKHGKQIKVAA